MRLAVLALGSTVVLGVVLALPRAGFVIPGAQQPVSEAHVVFGLLGWILLLVIGVAYQVVPMFQITPPYPAKMARWLAGVLFVLLIAHALALHLPQSTNGTLFTGIGLSAGVLSFAAVTLRLQSRRRRKLPDTTLDFWRLGMGSLVLCVATWLAGQVWPAWRGGSAYALMLGVLFLMGFAASVVNGMLYKIVPFLAWFHLQAQLQARAGSIPNMKQMIAEKGMRLQFRLHLAACLLLVAAVIKPGLFAVPAGAAMALSALLLWANLLSAAWRFVRHGGRLR
jgi:hypothetical protein